MIRKVTTGENALSFHDATTGITVCKGEVVELRENQFQSRIIRRALNSGHLRLVENKDEVKVNTESDIEKLDKKLTNQFKKGMTIDKMAKGLSLDQAKSLANIHNVTVEEEDTTEDILRAIFEDEEE